MRLSDFDFALPEELIATRPARPRSAARLLVVRPDTLEDRTVGDLPGLLRAGDLLVTNDTRVLPARLTGTRRRGEAVARVEVTLLEPARAGGWCALAKPLRKLRPGEVIDFGGLSAEVAGIADGVLRLRFDAEGEAFDTALARVGAMPLPPYIAARRAPDAQDAEDYQPVFAANPGAVAAPTASLHFDADLLAALDARGVERVAVTLHVGAGTFLPVKTDDLTQHRMHAERGVITPDAAARIDAALREGRRVIPVGTTALRLLEAAAPAPRRMAAFDGATDIFLRPGHVFRACDGLMTNFHLPRSTLLVLVAALMGRARMLSAYDHAIRAGYRFFSYGDASLLLP